VTPANSEQSTAASRFKRGIAAPSSPASRQSDPASMLFAVRCFIELRRGLDDRRNDRVP